MPAGSSRVPATGFKGMRTPLTISRAGEMRMPSSHTCANQLVLSEYPDKEMLRQHLHDVLRQPAGFHFR
jgi:HECT-domain (ubiquitin-transferase)